MMIIMTLTLLLWIGIPGLAVAIAIYFLYGIVASFFAPAN